MEFCAIFRKLFWRSSGVPRAVSFNSGVVAMTDEPSTDRVGRPGKPLLVWAALAIAITAAMLSALSYRSSREAAQRVLRVELDAQLDEAWGLIGGDALDETIATFSYHPRRLEKARRIVTAAVAQDQDLARGAPADGLSPQRDGPGRRRRQVHSQGHRAARRPSPGGACLADRAMRSTHG